MNDPMTSAEGIRLTNKFSIKESEDKEDEDMKIIKRRKQHGKWSGERGSILALSTLGMTAMLLAVGLSVDTGHFYLVAAELQNAADAAALSGASALNSTPGGITLAVSRARAEMNKYEFNKTGVTIEDADVRFAINLSEFDSGGTGMSAAAASAEDVADDVRFVQVIIPPKAVRVFFAVTTLGSTVDISKRAVAGQSVGLNYFCNIAPLSVVQDDITGEPLNVNPECPNQTEYTPGCTYTVRLQGGGSVSPGNYLPLDLTGGGGGADELAQRLALGTNSCLAMDSLVDTETGVNAGPVASGLNTRFDVYSGHGLNAVQHPPDKNVFGRDPMVGPAVTYQQYSSDPSYFQAPPNNAQYGVSERRVMIIPILNVSQFGNGNTRNIQVSNFGAFFLQDSVIADKKDETPVKKSGDLRMEYIGMRSVFGDGGYDPNAAPGPNPSLTVAVLYR